MRSIVTIRLCGLVLFFVLLPIPAVSAPLKAADFAYGIRLDPVTGGAVYRLYLPEAVHRSVVRQDLGDLRVFNERGEIIPHILRRPEESGLMETDVLALPFFPVDGPEKEMGVGFSIDITTDAKGAVLNARTRGVTGDGLEKAAYLIDAGKLDRPPDRLRLDWQGPDDSFVGKVSLLSSDDLDHWRMLASGVTLAALRHGKHLLRRDTIFIPEPPGRFITILWPRNARETILTRVEALVPKASTTAPRRHLKVPFSVAAGDSGAYVADLGGFFLVDRLNLLFGEPNSLTAGRFCSRSDTHGAWQQRFEGLFYDLSIDGTRVVNDAAVVGSVMDRWWRFEAVSRNGGMGERPPVLSVGWVPMELVFLARGDGPFTLAYGHAAVAPFDLDRHPLVHLLMREKNDVLIRQIAAGPPFSLQGESARVPKKPFPWKKWILWGVLSISVVLLGVMARGLYRQMNPPPGS
ncbi:DUF3999 domain-containing protein [Desulfococcus sp.]|uniref:DUF3999 domain-containing protein n=1 Tax=Desulfococcus sp. TaxID=2025834 RepID=UPI003D0AC954